MQQTSYRSLTPLCIAGSKGNTASMLEFINYFTANKEILLKIFATDHKLHKKSETS